MNHNFSPPGLIALFEDYCKRQNFAAVTKSAQRRLLNRLISYMETIAVSTYTPEVGESFIVAATEGKNLKNVTINSYRRLVYLLSQAYKNKTNHPKLQNKQNNNEVQFKNTTQKKIKQKKH